MIAVCFSTGAISKQVGKGKGRYDPKSNIKEIRELTRRKPGRTTREKKPLSDFTVRSLRYMHFVTGIREHSPTRDHQGGIVP